MSCPLHGSNCPDHDSTTTETDRHWVHVQAVGWIEQHNAKKLRDRIAAVYNEHGASLCQLLILDKCADNEEDNKIVRGFLLVARVPADDPRSLMERFLVPIKPLMLSLHEPIPPAMMAPGASMGYTREKADSMRQEAFQQGMLQEIHTLVR